MASKPRPSIGAKSGASRARRFKAARPPVDQLPVPTPDVVASQTRSWIEHAVVGLGLCPFAKPVVERGLLRVVVSPALDTEALLQDLVIELQRLATTPAAELETSLLVHPHVGRDFAAYNDFLDVADAALEALGLEGELQIASFHPDYRFAGTAPDDIENATNRAPWPSLHLLREASIERAVAGLDDTASIYERNMQTMRALGHEGWAALMARITDPAEPDDPDARPAR